MGEISEAVKIDSGVKLSTVAAITAALVAGGFLGEGRKITGIRRKGGMNPWKKSGIGRIMMGRDFTIGTF